MKNKALSEKILSFLCVYVGCDNCVFSDRCKIVGEWVFNFYSP